MADRFPVRTRIAPDPDGVPRVLLQIPAGYILIDEESARTIAGMLLEAADELAEVSNG